MPVLFLDSSALVKRYVCETGSIWVQHQTDATAQNSLYVVRLTGVEVVSAIARKARAGGMSAADALSATADFQADFPAAYNLVEITPSLTVEAMRLVGKHALRAYDALQLAAALHVNDALSAFQAAGLTLLSADAELNAAAQAEGLVVDDPNRHP